MTPSLPTLEEALTLLRSCPLESYLDTFFHRGAREFVVCDPQDPFSAVELAWLNEADKRDNPNNYKLHFETIEETGLVKVWQVEEYKKSVARREVLRAECEVMAAEHEKREAIVKKVKAAYIKMYGETNGLKRFADMINGELDIPGEAPMKAKFGL